MVALPITTFVDPNGAALSDGYLLLAINTDATTSTGQLLGYHIVVRIQLDINGTIEGSPTFWPNNELTPDDTYYVLRAYTSTGQLVFGPIKVFVSNGMGWFGTAFGSFFGS